MAKKYDEINGIKLTPRQWATYRLIEFNSSWSVDTTQEDIVNNYPIEKYSDGYELSKNPKAHDKCSAVWQDINEINMNINIHKVIISPKPYEYKMAETEEEVKEYCKDIYFKPAMAKLHRYSVLLNKVKRNGQGKLIFDSKSQARDYWETFIKENIDDIVEMSMGKEETTDDYCRKD